MSLVGAGNVCRTPVRFEPVCLDHAARLIGQRPWAVSRDADLLVAAHVAAMRTYGVNSCIVGVDVYNVEAEAYGGEVLEPDGDGVPTMGPPGFSAPGEIMALRLDPARDGRLPMVMAAARALAVEVPGASIHIPLAGPFTIASHLLGLENLICGLAMEPAEHAAALMHLADNQLAYARAAMAAGFGVTLYESAAAPPLLSPDLFAGHLVPALVKILTGIAAGARREAQLVIGGDTAPIARSMAELPVNYLICPVETDQARFLEILTAHPGKTVRVNMSPAVFRPGNGQAALAEARRATALAARRAGATVGVLLPFDAEPETVRAVAAWFSASASRC